MSFQTALSGLNGASSALDAIGNNVANSGTVGFKESLAQFADVFAASLAGSGASQIGVGTNVAAISQQFTQGNISTTNNPLDLAINGNGFFQMSNSAGVSYTRNGQFQVDKDGNLVNAQGRQLNGYIALPGGTSYGTTAAPINVAGAAGGGKPQATGTSPLGTGVQLSLNLNSGVTPASTNPAPTLIGSAAAGTTITSGTNNSLTVTVNNSTQTVFIPPGPIPAGLNAGTYASAGALASAVQAAINAAFPTGAGVSVIDSGGGVIKIMAQTGGVNSSLTVAGNGAANLLGTNTGPATGSNTFSILNPLSYNSSTTATVYDTLGQSHILGMYFVKTADTNSNTWNLYTNLDGGAPAPTVTSLIFNDSGTLISPSPAQILQTWPVLKAAPLSFNLDLSGSTQYASPFGVNSVVQDGYTTGSLAGLSASPDGILQGRYTNGQTVNLAQIALFKFANPNGLMSIGGNQWEETFQSGQNIPGAPNARGMGTLQSGAIEESNVDLTAQLVNMITAQRAYQANAQTIKTQDALMQTLVNLR